MSKSKPLESQADAYQVIKDERRAKKEAKDKKKSKSKPTEAEDAPPKLDDVEPTASKKRKRDTLPEEIEVDVNAPEPVSKKAARKAKKAKTTPSTTETANASKSDSAPNAATTTTTSAAADSKRSTHGVWIGNLPWTATKATLTSFLTSSSDSISASSITRIHMPAPKAPPRPTWHTAKPSNRGFAYVDFDSELAMYAAMGLTETQMDGRALLIKDARNFEGRPDKPKGEEGEKLYDGKSGKGKAGAGGSEKPPSRKVFVGNLAFETTREDLEKHFGQCGTVVDVHMATFEDSGKSKGFAWVTFEDVDAATSAVNGFVYKYVEDAKRDESGSESEGHAVPKSRKRKWKLNKLMGRELRCEFAEDSTTRYQKRFGKEAKAGGKGAGRPGGDEWEEGGFEDGRGDRKQKSWEARAKPSGKPFQPKGKVDARTIKPGAAHANAPRASAAIVESTGKRTTFD